MTRLLVWAERLCDALLDGLRAGLALRWLVGMR